MDSVTEILIEKDKEIKDVVYKTLVFAGILVLCLASFAFLGSLGLLVAFLVVFLGIKVQDYFSVEFEYCVLNADIDIDRIFSKKRRKRYVSLESASIDLIAPSESSEAKDAISGREKKIYACRNKSNSDNYVIIGNDTKGTRVAVYVENNEALIEQFRRYIPRKVIL